VLSVIKHTHFINAESAMNMPVCTSTRAHELIFVETKVTDRDDKSKDSQCAGES
jgi:hypothetical protein